MKHFRTLLQAWIFVILGGCHLTLIVRFLMDFFKFGHENSLLQPVYDFSNTLLEPFENTFVPSMADDSVLDFSIVVAIGVFFCIWIICTSVIKILFEDELSEKGKKLLSLLFATIEGLFIFRLIFALLRAGDSSFCQFVKSITGVTVDLFASLLGDNKFAEVVGIVVSIFIVGLIWFTVYKLLSGITESLESAASKRLAKKRVEDSQPRPIVRASVEAASTMYKEEVVSSEPREESNDASQSPDYLVNDPNFKGTDGSPLQGSMSTTTPQQQQIPASSQQGYVQQSKIKSLGESIKGAAEEVLGPEQKESPAPFEEEEPKDGGHMPKSPLG